MKLNNCTRYFYYSFRTILVLIIMLLSNNVYPKDVTYHLETIPLRDGPNKAKPTCILEDRDGFFWVGTNNGLYRYDGTGFKVYYHHPGEASSIFTDEIRDLHEDDEGMLWITVLNRLLRLDKRTDSVEQFAYNNTRGNILLYEPMAEDRDGNLWIGTWHGILCKFDKKEKTFKCYPLREGLFEGLRASYRIFKVYIDRNGVIWLQFGGEGLCSFDPVTEKFHFVDDAPCELKVLYEDSIGRFWVTSYCGIYLFDRETRSYINSREDIGDLAGLKDQSVRAVLEDSRGNFWVKTFEGMYLYSPDLELIFHQELDNNLVIVNDRILEDRNGIIWFMNEGGINKYTLQQKNFKNFEIPTDEFITTFYLDREGIVWFGGQHGGIYRYDRIQDSFRSWNLNDQGLDRSMFHVEKIYGDSDGTIWIGTRIGLWKLMQDGERIRFRRIYPAGVVDSTDKLTIVKTLFEDSHGRLWIGIRNHRPAYLDQDTEKLIHITDPAGNNGTLNQGNFIIRETSNNILWGAGYFLQKIILPLLPVDDSTVMPSAVIDIYPDRWNDLKVNYGSIQFSFIDRSGMLWLCTWGDGIFRIDPEVEAPIQWNAGKNLYLNWQNGLFDNSITGMLEDEHGNFWMSTSVGISKLNLEEKSSIIFTSEDGLPSDAFRNAAAQDPDGYLYFSTPYHLVRFHPDSLQLNEQPPAVFITDLKLHSRSLRPGNSDILNKNIEYMDQIRMKHHENTITIEFAALNYIHPEDNMYRYKLEGIDKDWVQAALSNSVTYAKLPPGEYLFRVIACNNDGVWNNTGAALGIMIQPPFWYSIVAHIIYIIVLTGLVLLVWKVLKRRAHLMAAVRLEHLENKKIKELDSMKNAFIANISHEFRTPLSLLISPIEAAVQEQDGEPDFDMKLLPVMLRSARRILQLIDQLLDISRLESGIMKVNYETGDLSAFCNLIAGNFESIAASKEISFEIDNAVRCVKVRYDPDKVEKILTNLLSNAFKYSSKGGRVRFRVEFPGEMRKVRRVQFTISDNGMGMEQEEVGRIFNRFYRISEEKGEEPGGTGIGLAIVKELVDLLHGSIDVESQPGFGTTFLVILPIEPDPEKTVLREPENRHPGENLSSDHAEKEQDGIEVPVSISYDRKAVLIVEDHADMRSFIRGKLGNSYTTIEAKNGNAGLRLARKYLPDLIITDLKMPKMDGMEMCSEIRKDPLTSHIPIIMLTARADRDTRLEGWESGLDAYIVKPPDARELLLRVKNLIHHREMLKEAYRNELLYSGTINYPEIRGNEFIRKLLQLIEEHLADPALSRDLLAENLHVSKSTLTRKTSSLTGLSPNEMIRRVRMKKAAELIKSNNMNITQVMYEVGIRNPSHFAKVFKSYFGMNPSDYKTGKS